MGQMTVRHETENSINRSQRPVQISRSLKYRAELSEAHTEKQVSDPKERNAITILVQRVNCRVCEPVEWGPLRWSNMKGTVHFDSTARAKSPRDTNYQ